MESVKYILLEGHFVKVIIATGNYLRKNRTKPLKTVAI
jgi:hypothetical protein